MTLGKLENLCVVDTTSFVGQMHPLHQPRLHRLVVVVPILMYDKA